jgi:hypothetical protein
LAVVTNQAEILSGSVIFFLFFRSKNRALWTLVSTKTIYNVDPTRFDHPQLHFF